MARAAQKSNEKRQSIITLRHEGQSIWKMSRTLKVSSSAVAKSIKCYDEITSGLGLVGLAFVFQQDNDPTHLNAV